MSPSAASLLAGAKRTPKLSLDNPAVADVTVKEFILDGRPMDADVVGALIDVGLDRKIDGATVLTATLADPRYELLNSRVFRKAVDLWIDDLAFRLADRDLGGDDGAAELTLTFEARAVASLRKFTKPMHASRKDKTRAEFVKAMCDEAGIELVCPRLHKRQPIQSVADAMTPAQKRKERHPGLKKGVKLTGIGGVALNSHQIANADRAMATAHSRHAPALAQLALLEACIIEAPNFDNPAGGDASSVGILQLLNIHLGGSTSEHGGRRDIEKVCGLFLDTGFTGKGGAIKLATDHPDWSAGRIAQAVQGSAFPDRYEGVREQANKVLEAFGTDGITGAGSTVQAEYAVAYMFRRGQDSDPTDDPEDSWRCMRRLADEVNWRLWEDAGRIYFMPDDDILRARVELTITPGMEGLRGVPTGRLSTRKPLQEVTIDCDARRWSAPPGTVVELDGYADFDGRWVVAEISRDSLFATATTITLHRRQKAILEPAHDTRQRSSDPAEDPSTTAGDLPAGSLDGTGGTGEVKIASGANLQGKPMTAAVMGYLKRTSEFYGKPIIVTTGTHHDRLSTSGLVSDHFTGNAADIGMAANGGTDLGPVGDLICACALMAGGVPKVDALAAGRKRGGAGFHTIYHNGYRIQVLWGFNDASLGGDHTNHVHVGLKLVSTGPANK